MLVTLEPTVLICVKFIPSSDRSIRKPCSVLDLSAQTSLTCVGVILCAAGPAGAKGGTFVTRVRPRSVREKL